MGYNRSKKGGLDYGTVAQKVYRRAGKRTFKKVFKESN